MLKRSNNTKKNNLLLHQFNVQYVIHEKNVRNDGREPDKAKMWVTELCHQIITTLTTSNTANDEFFSRVLNAHEVLAVKTAALKMY